MMGGRKVIIRTLDIGADKKIDYFKLDKEDNPALGYRAVRICLDRPEILRHSFARCTVRVRSVTLPLWCR